MSRRVAINILFFSLILLPIFALAAPDYLVPSNCIAGCPCSLCDLYTLGKNIVDFLLFSIAVPIGAALFLYGGAMLLTSGGNEKQLGKGKSAMTGAVVGMAIAFFAWAIMNVILTTIGFQINFKGALKSWYDPPTCKSGGGDDTCNIKLPEPAQPIPTVPGTPGPTPSPGGPFTDDEKVRAELRAAGIDDSQINKPCVDPTKRYQDVPGGQTCLGGLSPSAIQGLKELELICNCVQITGGTEPGHKSHGPGQPMVDLSFGTPAIETLNKLGYNEANFQKGYTCEHPPGKKVACSSFPIDHIHVEF